MNLTNRTYSKDSPTIVVDFDGTLIRQDLGKLFSEWLRKENLISRWHLLKSTPLGLVNYLSRNIFEFPLCNRMLMPVDFELLSRKASSFVALAKHDIEINTPLLDLISNYEGNRILLTGSLEILVLQFLNQMQIDCFDRVIGQTHGHRGWFLNPTPFGRCKPQFVDFSIEIAIANDRTDRHLLGRAKHRYLVLPSTQSRPKWADSEVELMEFGAAINNQWRRHGRS